jgi:pilus assembly protein CpaC
MNRLLIVVTLALSFAATHAYAMVVPVNRSTLITIKEPIGEVMIANPEVADVHVHNATRISVIGKKRGVTTLRVLGKDGDVIHSSDINVTYDLPQIRKALQEFMPEENIGVELVNRNVVLTGNVSNAAAVDKALRITRQFVEEDGTQGGSDTAAALEAKILNLLQVTSGQQVMLRVRVGEIKRTALKQLGANVSLLNTGSNSTVFGGTGGGLETFNIDRETPLSFGQFEVTEGSFGILGGVLRRGNFGVGMTLEALESDGLLKVLAEPNLVALSGEKADFLAGGEFPIPVSDGDGGITIEYKPFGVGVQFIPYVLAENRIRLTVLPEVSELDDADGVNIGGVRVPTITTRRARTTVELAPGESFMVAGLIRDEMSTAIRQIPGLNEVPILSALFRSTAYQRNETELVIAVTPYLVDPLKSSDVRLPTDGLRPPSNMEMFFYGALSSIAHGERKISQTPSLEGPIGFMLD